ncbi:MAG TPA: MarR family transcriptional regulator [Pseudonocardiaceae bacterium]|jgi:DNA-binding MarR family transcriptional regulator|nr:MarR family transcriptional regulator [Pseudonocardiaceae bacterium]
MTGPESEQRAALVGQVLAGGRQLSTAAIMFHTAIAAKSGLSATEAKVAELLHRFGPMTAGELSERSGLAPASVTGLMDRLEQKNVARRVKHPEDKRKVVIEIVPEFLTTSDARFTELLRLTTELCATYTDEELATIGGFLTKAADLQTKATATLTEPEQPPSRD